MGKSTKQNFKYYKVCTPHERNVGSGNFCINLNELANYDKDFIFDQNVDGVQYNKVLSKHWVKDNLHTMYKRVVDEETGKERNIPFCVIRLEDIKCY
jgi:hypothetical protein